MSVRLHKLSCRKSFQSLAYGRVQAAACMHIVDPMPEDNRRDIMTYKGIVKGKTIEFEAPLALPEGTEVDVEVHVRPKQALAASSVPQGSGQALLWVVINR
jgi:hypothetical protein